jgi:pyrroloquinoline quinone (PQQ) biosynthesis protein C
MNGTQHVYLLNLICAFQLYVSQNQSEDKKKSIREQLLKNISDQEKRSKALKDQQKKVKESLGLASKQVQLWGQLEKLFQCKQKCLEDSKNTAEDSVIHREPGTETLVL